MKGPDPPLAARYRNPYRQSKAAQPEGNTWGDVFGSLPDFTILKLCEARVHEKMPESDAEP